MESVVKNTQGEAGSLQNYRSVSLLPAVPVSQRHLARDRLANLT